MLQVPWELLAHEYPVCFSGRRARSHWRPRLHSGRDQETAAPGTICDLHSWEAPHASQALAAAPNVKAFGVTFRTPEAHSDNLTTRLKRS